MRYVPSCSNDPTFNLAMEQYVFERLDPEQDYVMLWQNAPSVIVGRHQNTFAEINEPVIRERKIQVVRRLSGGGAVYHDLGNLNFTFVVRQEQGDQMDLKLFCQPVIRTLRAFGVEAELNGRNDITVEGKKFSGNAQYRKNGRVMHHGTILFNSDLSAVADALRVSDNKLQAKGVKSVRSRVTNLQPYLPRGMTLEKFSKSLLKEIFSGEEIPQIVWHENDWEEICRLRDTRYRSWEWNYGSSPPGSLVRKTRVEGCGCVEVRLEVRQGQIDNLHFYGDFFSLDGTEKLAEQLNGLRFAREELYAKLMEVPVERYIVGLSRHELAKLLLSQDNEATIQERS